MDCLPRLFIERLILTLPQLGDAPALQALLP